MADDLIPIVPRAYEVAVALDDPVNRFPRAHTPLLGRELTGLTLRLLVTLVTANRRRDKVPELEAASGALDALRITLRLSTRLRLLSHEGDIRAFAVKMARAGKADGHAMSPKGRRGRCLADVGVDGRVVDSASTCTPPALPNGRGGGRRSLARAGSFGLTRGVPTDTL